MKSLLVGLLIFFLVVPSVFAQEELNIDTTTTPTPLPDVTYTLPYPGILPDNPLYSLKAARDRVVSFFITDPVKKAEFDLLQADKRIQAGIFLLQKENPDIPRAITTISKGQNYFEQAVGSYHRAKSSKKPTEIGDLPDRLTNAAKKHHEVLQKAAQNIPAENREEFMALVTRSESLINHIVSTHKE